MERLRARVQFRHLAVWRQFRHLAVLRWLPTRRARNLALTSLVLVSTVTLSACGGGSSGNGSGNPPTDTTPPSVPMGVTATAQSATEVRVSWQASTDAGSGVGGYHVFRNGGTAPMATVNSATNYTDANLTASTQYRYVVTAFDQATPPNESAASATATVTTPSSSPPNELKLTTRRVFGNLPAFDSLVLLVQAPGDESTWYAVEQGGHVRAFANAVDVSTTRSYVDLTDRVHAGGEAGLLGMAFDPSYPNDPRVFVCYTASVNGDLVSRISAFRTTDGGQTLDPATEQILLTVTQPASNHNGGNVVFGPDGMLYVGFGDGGSADDPWGAIGNGQNLRTILGKFVRIDVHPSTSDVPYRIPQDNPYVGNALCAHGSSTTDQPCPEIYAYGFRNPWRWSFDRANGELWVGDVGQGALEEVDRVELGGNYGWRCYEGTQLHSTNCGPNAATSQPPIAQYDHSAGIAITGGYVYRGTAIPALAGRYVFGDFGSGRLWHIARTTAPTLTVTTTDAAGDTSLAIASFAETASGELYAVDYGGTIHEIVAAP